jgi:hypothetical protein
MSTEINWISRRKSLFFAGLKSNGNPPALPGDLNDGYAIIQEGIGEGQSGCNRKTAVSQLPQLIIPP